AEHGGEHHDEHPHQRGGAAQRDRRHGEDDPDDQTEGAEDHLLHPEGVRGGAAPGQTQPALELVRSAREPFQEPQHAHGDGNQQVLEHPAQPAGAPRRREQRPRTCAAQVRIHPGAEIAGTQPRKRAHEEEETDPEQEAEPDACQDGIRDAHRSTLSSWGRRAIRSITRYARSEATAPATISTRPGAEAYACAAWGRVAMRASTIHGAARARRAAFTVQDGRATSSARVRASSRREAERRRSRPPRSVPPTSRVMRSASTIRSPTGSARRIFRRSRLAAKSPLAW